MTNIEKLTAHINACKHRRQIYSALLALAPLIRAAHTEQQRAKLLEELKEGAKEHEQCTDDP